MGLYDRDYGRDAPTPWDRAQNPKSMAIILIVINVVVFFADQVFCTSGTDPYSGEYVKRYLIPEWAAAGHTTLTQPWMWWQFLSYAFVHDTKGVFHLLFNMVGLFVFGRSIEHRMGRFEFLRFYLLAAIVGGIVGAITALLAGGGSTIGASGAVIACAIMFACYYPNRELLLMFVFPVKAWVLAVIFVVADLAGALGWMSGMGGSNTAFTVHLAGAFFAIAYYFLHWNLSWLAIGGLSDVPRKLRQRSRRMKLKLHDPDKKLEQEAEDADRILAKIHSSGEDSLTSSERKTLERYSRRQREKRDQ